MKKGFVKVLAVALILALALATGCAPSQPTGNDKPADAPKKIEYPTKAVTMVVGFKPGGGGDQLVQLVKPFMEKEFGQQIATVYKTGADGAIAWKEVAELTGEKADGYTLTIVLTPKTQINQFVNPTAGYKMEDYKGIANIVFDPGMMVVGPDSKFKTMKELLDYAKANPGKLKMSNSGTGGDDWFNAVSIEKLAGVTFNNIPFEGDAPAWQAAAGGHVDANTNNLSTVTPLIKGGKLVPLAIYDDKRSPVFPDVPTMKELGIDFSEGSSRGFIAPKDTPQEIIDIWADALEKVCKDPEFIKAAEAANIQVRFMRGAEFQSYLDDQNKVLKQTVTEMGLVK